MKSFSNLPSGYIEILKVNLQKDKKLAILINGAAIVVMLIMGVVMHLFVPITVVFDSIYDAPFSLLIRMVTLIAGYVAYIVLHELIHGIAMKICGTKKVKFGFTGLYAFAGSDDYYNKKAYIFIALAPVVLWGVVLAVLNFLVPYEWIWVVYFIQIGNISGAAGDAYVTLKFMKLPKDIVVKDSGVEMTVYSSEKNNI